MVDGVVEVAATAVAAGRAVSMATTFPLGSVGAQAANKKMKTNKQAK
jgi:hypothetical protein